MADKDASSSAKELTLPRLLGGCPELSALDLFLFADETPPEVVVVDDDDDDEEEEEDAEPEAEPEAEDDGNEDEDDEDEDGPAAELSSSSRTAQ